MNGTREKKLQSRKARQKGRLISPGAPSEERSGERLVLITGGAGFIGTNLADRILSKGQPVLIYDNFSRPGVTQNASWLHEKHGERVRFESADILDPQALDRAVGQASRVFHFAAQVAVTTSLLEPILDFEVNLRGTINLLEALRKLENPPPLIFASTNKVYGCLDDVALRRNGHRYEPREGAVRLSGISESHPLDFNSPFGCSKGAADQYVLDYARTFGIPAAVFRMSCIYGPHQFGTEDQGWVAHFLIRAMENGTITFCGDGMQVRDILFIEDLIDAFLLAQENIGAISGHAFNIGGGPENTVSLVELLDIIHELHGRKPSIEYDDWRPCDQRYYVSDFGKFEAATGWAPRVSVTDGVNRLYQWLTESRLAPPMQRI